MANILNRSKHSFIDKFGTDPLKDKAVEAVLNVTSYTLYTITEDEENNIPLLSYNAYNTVDMWWVIMLYNGIFRPEELVAGTQIKIPLYSDVVSALSDIKQDINNNSVTI